MSEYCGELRNYGQRSGGLPACSHPIFYQVIITFLQGLKYIGCRLIHFYYHPLGISTGCFYNGRKILSPFAKGYHRIGVIVSQGITPFAGAILHVEQRSPLSKFFDNSSQDPGLQLLPNRCQFQKRFPAQAIAKALRRHNVYPLYSEIPTNGCECQTGARLHWQIALASL